MGENRVEVVINSCYGGFGLSHEAERFFAKLQGKELYFYLQTKHEYQDGEDEYTRIDSPKGDEFLLFTLTRDLGKTIKDFPNEEGLWFNSREIKRNDKNLITVIRMLGEKANGKFSELKIIQIPDGVDWEISEYDGIETVEEKHRSWS